MEDSKLEKIKSKYVIRLIFSLIKTRKSLQIIKINKELMERIDINLFHYQLYCLYSILKSTEIYNFNDIIDSPYMKLFPENVKYEIIFRLMKKEKLQGVNYINIYDEEKISLIMKFMDTFNNEFIIGDKEISKYFEKDKDKYRDAVISIISNDKKMIQKILYDSHLFENEKNYKNKIDYKDVKYLNVSNYISKIPLFDNLKYLSLSGDLYFLKLSENQFKNIKVFKRYESAEEHFYNKHLWLVNKNNREGKFQNLEELYIKETFLNDIQFAPEKLKKLNLIFDFRDKIYTFEYIINTLNIIIENYSSLVDLNIEFFYVSNESMYYDEFIKKIFNYIFNLINNLENISFKFNYLECYKYTNESKILSELLVIMDIKNKRGKIMIKDTMIDISLLEPMFNNIEEIELLISCPKHSFSTVNNNIVLLIDENNSMSKITKLKVNIQESYFNSMYIPIKSFSSLTFLKFEIDKIVSTINFPLFKNPEIKFDNLEYLHIDLNIFALEHH